MICGVCFKPPRCACLPLAVVHVKRLRLGRGGNDRGYSKWAAEAASKERGATSQAFMHARMKLGLKAPPGPPWRVRMVRLSEGHTEMDTDNLTASLKNVRDAVCFELGMFKRNAKGGVVVLDGPRDPISFECDQEINQIEWGVRIELLPPEGTAPRAVVTVRAL